MFGKTCLNVDPSSKDLVLTEPYFNFGSIQEGLNEVLFEEYQFRRVMRTTPADLACYKSKLDRPGDECCLVIDSGRKMYLNQHLFVVVVFKTLTSLSQVSASPTSCRSSGVAG